jgi:hypothetical protein
VLDELERLKRRNNACQSIELFVAETTNDSEAILLVIVYEKHLKFIMIHLRGSNKL